MLFNSLHYLVFLPVVTALYFALPHGRPRRLLLLIASFYFYWVFSIKWSLVLVWASVLDYTVARLIERWDDRPRLRKAALIASLVGNLGTLGFFKYLNFFNQSIATLTGEPLWPMVHLILPMGISFYTFQTMSYTIDVYRRVLKAEHNFLDYMLFVTYFPHFVAGPILRAKDILPQFRERHAPNSDRILSGALLVVWGLLKKVFIADPMGRITAVVYGTATAPRDPAGVSGMALLLGTYAFALQIYCDFSGYSDIAIGSGRILGFRIPQNFDRPYLATSIRDFWRRWHISLSTWLRDYLYIPLGGSRGTQTRTYLNLMITMFLGGLWHGANWTFVIWGLLHGAYLAIERGFGIEEVPANALPFTRFLRGIITFHLVCLGWVFFRAATASQALGILKGIATWQGGASIGAAPLVALVVVVAGQWLHGSIDVNAWWLRRPVAARWAVYGALATVATALASGRSPEFIYFQF